MSRKATALPSLQQKAREDCMIRDWLNRTANSIRRAAGDPVPEVREVHGIEVAVVNTRPDISTERVFGRAAAVIALVDQYQPWRAAHLRRDLARIIVVRYACRGAYLAETRECMLELTFMANEDFSDAQVAATLVHEGMHARLDRLAARYGVTSFEMAPARHERICRRAELEWGEAVPDGEAVIRRARESLALRDDDVAPAIDWREAARRIEAADRAR